MASEGMSYNSNKHSMSASDAYSSLSTGSRKSKKSYLFVQGKFQSNYHFFFYSLAYTVSVDCFISTYKVGSYSTEMSLIQCFAAYVLVGIPIYYMQMILGQYCQMSMVYFKHMVPLGHGIVFTTLLTVFLYIVKHGILLGDFCLFFLLAWQRKLPWMICTNKEASNVWGKCFSGMNDTLNCTKNCINNETFTSAYLYLLGTYMGVKPDEIDDFTIDFPNIHRCMGLVTGWIIIFIVVAIIFPRRQKILFLFLIEFYIFVLLLNMGTSSTRGGMNGIQYLFKEESDNLKSIMAWCRGVAVTIRELKLAHAFIMLNASRLKAKSNSGALAVGFCVTTYLTSLICTCFFQSSIGMIARRAHTEIPDVEHLGMRYHLTRFFVLIPQSLGYLTVPQIWSLLYFSCMMTIILANEVTYINTLHSSLAEVCPSINRYQIYVTSAYCGLACLCGIFMIGETNYSFANHFSSRILCLLELINVSVMSFVVFWIYGVRRLGDDICFMSGSQPTKFWKITWYLMPFLTSFSAYYEYVYHNVSALPASQKFFIQIIMVVCVSPIPLLVFIEIFWHMRSRNLTGLFRPTYMWGPPDPEERHKRFSFNPRKETTYQSKITTCKHNCLLQSKVLKTLIEQETRHIDDFITATDRKNKMKEIQTISS